MNPNMIGPGIDPISLKNQYMINFGIIFDISNEDIIKQKRFMINLEI